jgi:DNA-binding CsgD family transcriptional regulator
MMSQVLRDRRNERRTLDALVEAVRAGESRALVVRGEPSVGKTALLDYLGEQVPEWHVARAAGVQSEMELAFAGLHQLCSPVMDQLERLPAPQCEALSTAFGTKAGSPPDRFLVGLAVLGLLAEVARERPLLCVVDDAQWLDRASAQALAFVARRILAESVALVFAVRDSHDLVELEGLSELAVGGLPDADARALLRSAYQGPVDQRVLDRLVSEARGNPLALLELPRGFTPAELAGGFGLLDAGALPGWIEESFRRQLTPLDDGTRRLLLLAAAEPIGDPVLVWRAAERLGISTAAGAAAAASGLVDFGARVTFRHPLVRSAIYRAARSADRGSAHQALAQVTDPDVDPDRRAWHAAQAAAEPDEEVAAELERSAGRAQARGGLAAAAAFLHRATELTPEPARRAGRALSAARVKYQAGLTAAALRLLSLAEAGPLDELQRAKADLLHAEIAFAVNRGGEAAPLLLDAAKRLEPLDTRSARDTYLEAFAAAQFAGQLANDGDVYKVATAARAAPPAPTAPNGADLLLDGLALRFTDGYAAGAPMLKQALAAFCDEDAPAEERLRWIWLPCLTAVDLWDDEAGAVLATRNVKLAREAGALAVLPLALTSRIASHVFNAELAEAASLLEEFDAVTEATGSPVAPYGDLLLAAWQGSEPQAVALIDNTVDELSRRGEGMVLTVSAWAKAVLYNGLGRYDDALAAAETATECTEELCFSNWGLAELVEAAVRCRQPERAVEALRRLTRLTRASGTNWALGTEAGSRALLSEGPAAEAAYREAIDRLGRTRIRGSLARAHLLYGEWLRRESRRVAARQQLMTAHDMFATYGMEAFADRAARELLATGEAVRKRTVESPSELTGQESQIVRLVRERLSNAEIADRLFISPRTVEWHLSKIFAKLQITSRRQLRR